MKIKYPLIALFSHLPLAQAAVTYTEDFSSGIGDFSPLNNTNTDTSSGALEFIHTNVANGQPGQGAGVSIEAGDALGSSLSSFLLDPSGAPIPDASLFFQWSTVVPAGTSQANDELGFFLGPAPNQAQSSDIFNGQNNNAFTLYINDESLFVQNNGQVSNNPNSVGNGVNGGVNLLSDLGIGTTLTMTVEWSLVEGANNGLASVYTVTASGIDATTGNPVTATGMFDGAQQNLNASTIDGYEFVASATQSLSGSLDNFTISDMAIPEPSTFLLSLLSVPALLWRRRNA